MSTPMSTQDADDKEIGRSLLGNSLLFDKQFSVNIILKEN